MIERLQNIENRYNELNEELMKPENISDIKKTLELTKEQANLKEAYETYQIYKKLLSDIEEASELTKDPELGEFAKEELEEYTKQKEELESKIEIMLLPKDPNDGKNVIVEIRGAAGGDEGRCDEGEDFQDRPDRKTDPVGGGCGRKCRNYGDGSFNEGGQHRTRRERTHSSRNVQRTCSGIL